MMRLLVSLTLLRTPALVQSLLAVSTFVVSFFSVSLAAQQPEPGMSGFWRDAELTDRQAAAHLLDRLAYGARPGDVDAVVAQGVEHWLETQLSGVDEGRELIRRLEREKVLEMSTAEIAETFPSPARTLRRLRSEGKISDEQIAMLETRGNSDVAGPSRLAVVRDVLIADGFRPRKQLDGILTGQKIVRAVHSENQLREVLTNFWFNHFNVSLSDNEARIYVLPYERDAIRPNVLGSFYDLLKATAQHPAMLLYLDNARSRAPEGSTTSLMLSRRAGGAFGARGSSVPRGGRQRPTGLNENYARELLELHTLGVDGGYEQSDVIAVARALTGWTLVPPKQLRQGSSGAGIESVATLRGQRSPVENSFRFGFFTDGSFLFHPGFHDAEAKVILGTRFPAGAGMEEGEGVLRMLSGHPSTARFLSRKLAARFVSDDPPESLVSRLALVFEKTDGNLAEVMRRLVWSPEFWDEGSRRSKIKSPFEVAVSGVRALGASVVQPGDLARWIERMGQPLYRYQAPTGYPDRAESWVSSGSLLMRMNFGQELSQGGVRGVRGVRPELLPDSLEPLNMESVLVTAASTLLPGRDLERVVRPLKPHLISAAAPADESEAERVQRLVGLVLGSPEFQRR